MAYSPAYEWHEAARFAGFRRYRDFARLPGEEQSEIVAHFRLHAQAEAVLAQEQQKKARRLANQKKGKQNH